MTDHAAILRAIRDTTPLVHCMTNTVVPEITANVLLAIGAAPAMIDLPEEAEIFATMTSALLINVGNSSSEQHAGMRRAAQPGTRAADQAPPHRAVSGAYQGPGTRSGPGRQSGRPHGVVGGCPRRRLR